MIHFEVKESPEVDLYNLGVNWGGIDRLRRGWVG